MYDMNQIPISEKCQAFFLALSQKVLDWYTDTMINRVIKITHVTVNPIEVETAGRNCELVFDNQLGAGFEVRESGEGIKRETHVGSKRKTGCFGIDLAMQVSICRVMVMISFGQAKSEKDSSFRFRLTCRWNRIILNKFTETSTM